MRTAYLPLAAACLLLTGCDEMFMDSQRYKEDFQYQYDVKPGVRVYLENMNGSVEIAGWEKNIIRIDGVKTASTEGGLKALKIDVIAQPDSVRIRTIRPSGHLGGYGARYTIRLPRTAVLESIESSNAPVHVDTIDGSVRLRTSNGLVRVARVNGPVELRTSNAPVELDGIKGSVIAVTSNGPVRAEDVKGSLDASTSNAGLTIVLSEPEAQRPVKLSTSNGPVELSIGDLRDNDVRINTSNGGITLRLPPDSHGQLLAHTRNGAVNSDFNVNVKGGELRKSWVEGTIGSGGPTFDLNTSNAGIRVLKH